ncbi:hypothetical protein CIG19_13895 [Enterobacterales bacterium CwR94]|nr:hypothetical protein CIG19_13895 [Enterobacterales bacterium CwR94]
MENKQEIHAIFIAHLASWRYFIGLSLIPLVVILHYPLSSFSLLAFVAMMLNVYYCWRLFLDERLFTLLHAGMAESSLDDALSRIWGASFTQGRDWQARWHGTRQLFRRAFAAFLGVWVLALLRMLMLVVS